MRPAAREIDVAGEKGFEWPYRDAAAPPFGGEGMDHGDPQLSAPSAQAESLNGDSKRDSIRTPASSKLRSTAWHDPRSRRAGPPRSPCRHPPADGPRARRIPKRRILDLWMDLLEMVEHALFRYHEPNAQIVPCLQLPADGLLRLLVRQ